MGKNDAPGHLNHNVTPNRFGEITRILALACHPASRKMADFRKALAFAGYDDLV